MRWWQKSKVQEPSFLLLFLLTQVFLLVDYETYSWKSFLQFTYSQKGIEIVQKACNTLQRVFLVRGVSFHYIASRKPRSWSGINHFWNRKPDRPLRNFRAWKYVADASLPNKFVVQWILSFWNCEKHGQEEESRLTDRNFWALKSVARHFRAK